jgi:ribosomal protein S27AE
MRDRLLLGRQAPYLAVSETPDGTLMAETVESVRRVCGECGLRSEWAVARPGWSPAVQPTCPRCGSEHLEDEEEA